MRIGVVPLPMNIEPPFLYEIQQVTDTTRQPASFLHLTP